MKWLDCIPESKDFITLKQIQKGWSVDQKYYVETKDAKMLLRVSPITTLEKRQTEYAILEQLKSSGINCSKPISFGVCAVHEICYSLLTWIDGNDLLEVLPTLSEKTQYELGYQAGAIYQSMQQTVEIPTPVESWGTKFGKKVDRNIHYYYETNIVAEYGDEIVAYLKNNKHLLAHRPQTFLHGDYHVGNLVIDTDNTIGIIDFNRHDIGDPWEDFNRIIWCVPASIPFSKGLLNGYFTDTIPASFWPLLKYYLYTTLIASVYWSLSFDEDELQRALDNITLANTWYQEGIDTPLWYTSTM